MRAAIGPMLLVLLAACDTGTAPGAAARRPGEFTIATTFWPTTYFARRIAGDDARVVCPLPPGEDPIFWMPGDDELATYQAADLIVVNGAQFEKWVAKVSLPEARVVRTAEAFRDRWLEFGDATTHKHGPSGEHAHTGVDGHTWLDPELAIAQADAIRAALAARLPDRAAGFDARFAALRRDLEGLREACAALGAPPAGRWLYASHPAYRYLAARFSWPLVSLDLDPQTMPDDGALAALGAGLASRPGTFLLWESEPDPAIARRLEEDFGLRSVLFSPCETPDDAGRDYLDVMRANLAAIAPALSDG